MEITLNHQLKIVSYKESLTVQQLIQQEVQGIPQGIAVAVNNRVIPKHLWKETSIFNNDQVMIIRAAQGG